ncbi:MAG: 30S ribosomal protein S2 [Candidatus Paceibacter sp.]|nr:30S ribosomal protein S2 [Candidatus Paceibacter sp.]
MLNTQEKIEQDLQEMFSKGMHLGYSVTSRHPKMKPYIFAERNGVEIFDLEKTKSALDAAKEFVRKLGKEKKIILFVGTKKEAKEALVATAKELSMPYVAERWVGGTITNFKQIRSRMDHLNDLKKKKETGALDKYTKKERLQIDRKIEKMDRYFCGLADSLKNFPAAIVTVDPKHEKIAMGEALQMKIPVISLLNSDCDPAGINFAVPANDNSATSIGYFLSELAKSYKEGLILAEEVATQAAAKKEPVKE